jgi:hypothetical protein
MHNIRKSGSARDIVVLHRGGPLQRGAGHGAAGFRRGGACEKR